jgi:hypothetical protein
MTGSIAIPSLPAGSSFTFDIAYIYARQDTSHYLNTLDLLNAYTDRIQWAYDNDTLPCTFLSNQVSTYETEIKDFEIYPNPCSEYITVRIPEPFSTVNYCIYNLAGQKVNQGKIQSEERISLINLNPGIYFIHLYSGDESISKKIIVQ